MVDEIILPKVGEEDRIVGDAGEKTIIHWIVKTYGAGGNIDLKPNTPKELLFGSTTLHYERLWGRINADKDSALWELDEPRPVATGTKYLIPFKATINSLDIKDDKVIANTNLGSYEVWSKP